MQALKILLVAIVILVASESVRGQRSGNVTKSRNNFSTPKIRGKKAKIICPVFIHDRYPYHGVGFKFGDPLALTYKFYPNKRFSLALDFGKAASGLYNDYFRDKFNSYVRKDTFATGESTLGYLTHRVRSDLIGELKVLYHVDAQKISDGLQVYAGAGWKWRNTELKYDYEYRQGDTALPASDPFGSFYRNRMTMGPQFVGGIEYAYFRIPVAAFVEVEYFTDLQADPGWNRFEGGVGLRYIFN